MPQKLLDFIFAALDRLRWRIVVVCAVVGTYFGFRVGGIGGAVVFTPLGAVAGFSLPELLPVTVAGVLVILAGAGIVEVVVLTIRLVNATWVPVDHESGPNRSAWNRLISRLPDPHPVLIRGDRAA